MNSFLKIFDNIKHLKYVIFIMVFEFVNEKKKMKRFLEIVFPSVEFSW